MAFVGPSVLGRIYLSGLRQKTVLVFILKEEKTEICGAEHHAELHINSLKRTDPRLQALYSQCIFPVFSLFE